MEESEKRMKSEKGEMKKMLWKWGQALERFSWKEEELRKLENFYEMRQKIWGEGRRDKEYERNEKQYAAEQKRIRMEMEEILLEKMQVDGWMQRLGDEEKMLIEMRFEKRYGFDYISMKMHRSRATLFRMQDRALEKLILQREKIETP